MNLIERKTSIFPSFLDELFGTSDIDFFNARGNLVPAVNIKETRSSYELQMAVPGKAKKDFEIEFENDLLSISSKFSEEKNSDSKESFPVHEFSYNDFKRLFKVPKIVEADKINAKYVNGVLQVSLPKLKEAILRSKKIIKIS